MKHLPEPILFLGILVAVLGVVLVRVVVRISSGELWVRMVRQGSLPPVS